MKTKLTLLFIIVFFAACHKDPGPIDNSPTPNPSGNYTHGVFVMNEGNFQWGNASVSFIHLNDFSIENNVYEAVNQQTLGDVAQSMTIHANKAYLVVNNSHTIVIVNLSDFKTITKISGFNSPRYMLVVNDAKAYVSDLYQNAIYVVNLESNTIQKTVVASGWTERMLMLNGRAFITNMDNANVLVMDTTTDAIVDSISTVKEPNSFVIDYLDRLWVLCSGGANHEQIPALMCINPSTLQVVAQYNFNAGDYPTELCINKEGTELFYLNSGVYRMSTSASTLPTMPLIAQSGKVFYRMGVHPQNNDVFVTDAVDYLQDGWVMQFDSNGNALHSWKAGRIPGYICFYP